jgi:hypothetical protein
MSRGDTAERYVDASVAADRITINCLIEPSRFTRSSTWECWQNSCLLFPARKEKKDLEAAWPNEFEIMAYGDGKFPVYQFPAEQVCGTSGSKYCIRFCENLGEQPNGDSGPCKSLRAVAVPVSQFIDGTVGRGAEYLLDICSLLCLCHCRGKGVIKQLRTHDAGIFAKNVDEDYQVRTVLANVCRGKISDAATCLVMIPISCVVLCFNPLVALGEIKQKELPPQFKPPEPQAMRI